MYATRNHPTVDEIEVAGWKRKPAEVGRVSAIVSLNVTGVLPAVDIVDLQLEVIWRIFGEHLVADINSQHL